MSKGHVQHDTVNAFPPLPEKDCPQRFDSGSGVTFEDAVHHLFIMGTRGSGKTAATVLPAIRHLLTLARQGRLS